MKVADKVSVSEQEGTIPNGITLAGADFCYSVDISLIALAPESPEDDGEYHWFNPRRLGSREDTDGAGLGKEEMDDFREDIRQFGLEYPLLCRWRRCDGSVWVEVLDGERRYRTIKSLVDSNVSVWDVVSQSMRPASQVYKSVPCKIREADDVESLKIAFRVSERNVHWGEAAIARLVRHLRQRGRDDKFILSLTGKSPQWLREQDRIIQLDELTWSYLANGRINRSLALLYCGIEDMDERHGRLHAAYGNALAARQEQVKKADKDIERSIEGEQYAEGDLAEAKVLGRDVASAEAKLNTAREQTRKKRRAVAGIAEAKAGTVNDRRALAEGDIDSAEILGDPLRKVGLQKHVDAIQDIISKGGKTAEGKDVLDVNSLQACLVCYKSIMAGFDAEQLIRQLRIHRSKIILLDRREKWKASKSGEAKAYADAAAYQSDED